MTSAKFSPTQPRSRKWLWRLAAVGVALLIVVYITRPVKLVLSLAAATLIAGAIIYLTAKLVMSLSTWQQLTMLALPPLIFRAVALSHRGDSRDVRGGD